MTADERSFWLEIRRGYLTQLRAIDQRLGIHSSYRVDREPPAKPAPAEPQMPDRLAG